MAHAMPQVPGVDHRFVKAGDLSFHVASAGEGEGDPILLVHGWPQHWYQWRLVMPSLAERHRVLAIDLRGFGWTDIAWAGFEKENMADDVVRLLDALEVERVHYVGHDWGAWIGYLLALRRPDRVSHLVALNAPPPWPKPTLKDLPSLVRMRYQLALAAPFLGPKLVEKRFYVAGKIRHWARNRRELRKPVRALYTRDLKASTRARASTLMYRTFLTREILPVLAGRYRDRRLEVPTLVLYGQRDPILPPELYQGHEEHADRLRAEGVPRAGHFLPEERPELVTERILEFVDDAAEPVTGTAVATGEAA
jgi:pimeloyl-ACP methyl ester carboxylesterase